MHNNLIVYMMSFYFHKQNSPTYQICIFLILVTKTSSRTDEGQPRRKYIFNKRGTNIYFFYSTEVWSITITEFYIYIYLAHLHTRSVYLYLSSSPLCKICVLIYLQLPSLLELYIYIYLAQLLPARSVYLYISSSPPCQICIFINLQLSSLLDL